MSLRSRNGLQLTSQTRMAIGGRTSFWKAMLTRTTGSKLSACGADRSRRSFLALGIICKGRAPLIDTRQNFQSDSGRSRWPDDVHLDIIVLPAQPVDATLS